MLDKLKQHKGVFVHSKIQNDFPDRYLQLREQEGRILSDDEVKKLPHLRATHKHHKEWQLRAKSAKRMYDYIKGKNDPLNVLTIGCGNGCFANYLSTIDNVMVYGIDVNTYELEQAARLFNSNTCKFIEADIFELIDDYDFELPQPHIIVLNASVQYFEDYSRVCNRLSELFRDGGEVHIMDSPLYGYREIKKARERSVNYFKQMGFPEMAEHYFHHNWAYLQEFNYSVLYNGHTNIFSKIINRNDMPFPWIRIKF